jgi:hypothetical protein
MDRPPAVAGVRAGSDAGIEHAGQLVAGDDFNGAVRLQETASGVALRRLRSYRLIVCLDIIGLTGASDA